MAIIARPAKPRPIRRRAAPPCRWCDSPSRPAAPELGRCVCAASPSRTQIPLSPCPSLCNARDHNYAGCGEKRPPKQYRLFMSPHIIRKMLSTHPEISSLFRPSRQSFAPTPALPRQSLRSFAGEGPLVCKGFFHAKTTSPGLRGGGEGAFSCRRENLKNGEVIFRRFLSVRRLSAIWITGMTMTSLQQDDVWRLTACPERIRSFGAFPWKFNWPLPK